MEAELRVVVQKLLEAIAAKDWQTYASMCDPTLSCFEPETQGHLVVGLPFHQNYFPAAAPPTRKTTTMVDVHVRALGPDAAVVSYTRLIQDGEAEVVASQETRVFQKKGDKWLNVHFHRSPQLASRL